jgi:membrane fusion protein, macrolide-specific efflux system
MSLFKLSFLKSVLKGKKKMFKNNCRIRFPLFKTVIISFFVFTLLFSLTGCFLLPADEEVLASPVQLKEPEAAKINTEKAKRGNITRKVSFWGEFLSPSQYDLSFVYMGRLKNVYAAAGDNVKAGQILAELESDNLDSQLETLEINLQRAQLNYDRIKTEWEINGGGSKYQLEDAQLNIDLAKLPIEDLKQNLAKIRITAPISGIVSYVDDVEIGDNINLRTTFITVCDRNEMSLVVKRDTNTAWLTTGMTVNVSYNSKVYTGRIVKTSEDTVNEKDSNLRNTYIIKVDGLDTNTISLNDTAAVECILKHAENTLIIKKSNIKGDKNNLVYVFKNGAIEEREIVPGIESDNGIEI